MNLKLIIAFFLAVLFLNANAQVNNSSLTLIPIFIDEFDQGEVDTMKWQDSRFFKYHTRFWPAGVREQQYYVKFDDLMQNPSENYVFEYDNLIGKDVLSLTATENPITAKAVDWMDPNQIIEEDNLGLTNFRTFNYRSAELNSRMRFKYGMFVIRFKMPKGCGFWPAFWLYSGTHSDQTCINSNNDPNFQPPSYCAGDEIDFFEWESENPTLLPANLHYDHQNSAVLQYDIQTNQDLRDDYHFLYIEWQPSDNDNDGIIDDGFINWYFDPHITPQNYPLYPNYRSIHHYEYAMGLIINNAVGGPPYNFSYSNSSDFITNCIEGGSSPVGGAKFPAKFSIDHVSVFYRYECEAIKTLCNWNPDKGLPAYTGRIIDVAGDNCSVVVPGYEYDQWNNVYDGRDLKLIAGEKIVLKPGFHAKKGSRVSAVIRGECQRNSIDNLILTDTGSISLMKYIEIVSEKESINKNEHSKNNFNENEQYFRIFPNPTNGFFYIEYSIYWKDSDKLIRIYDNLGRTILELNENTYLIDLSNFVSGIYFVEIESKNKIIREKIIKI